MFESLSSKIDQAIKTLKGQGRISDINIAQTVKEIRKALIDADVNFKVAKEITDKIKESALGQNIAISVSPGQLFTKIVSDELTSLMGGSKVEINTKGDPAVILMSGLQGSGKTTFSAKLAKMLKSQGRKVLLVACDIYRPAAILQLQTLGEQIGVDVFAEVDNKNAVSIAQNSLAYAKNNNYKIMIVDTAGRLAVDTVMMQEIVNVKNALSPSEILFVVDAMTGQDAVNTAKVFNEKLNFDGVVLTKLDGDTRGGAAISIKYEVNKPIKYIGTSEKMDGIDIFHPERMAQRILGMGDIVSLVEKAQQVYDEEEGRRINKKIQKNTFDFNDFLSQLQQIEKMGNIKDVMSMIPGIGKQIKDVELDNNTFRPMQAMIQSMTKQEKENPDLITGNRRKRIAIGSGNSLPDVNKFMKQFEDMRKMMKMMNNKNAMKGMMAKMGMQQ